MDNIVINFIRTPKENPPNNQRQQIMCIPFNRTCKIKLFENLYTFENRARQLPDLPTTSTMCPRYNTISSKIFDLL